MISLHACHCLAGAGPTTRALSTPPAGRGAIHRCIKLQQPARRRLVQLGTNCVRRLDKRFQGLISSRRVQMSLPSFPISSQLRSHSVAYCYKLPSGITWRTPAKSAGIFSGQINHDTCQCDSKYLQKLVNLVNNTLCSNKHTLFVTARKKNRKTGSIWDWLKLSTC